MDIDWYLSQYISIHTALAGCDSQLSNYLHGKKRFQSTQPSQAVTFIVYVCSIFFSISIHTALAGCDGRRFLMADTYYISIHTALAGCDGLTANIGDQEMISIHTALAGCDQGIRGRLCII